MQLRNKDKKCLQNFDGETNWEAAVWKTEQMGKITLRSILRKWAVRERSGWNDSGSCPLRGLWYQGR
jgi:hypothetical protein